VNPSERIRAIREIANRLSAEEWSIIDLTLEQFGLPTSTSWDSSDKFGYVVQMLRGAADPDLQGLAIHVGADAGEVAAQSAVDAPFWKPGYFRLFISHLAVEKAFASELQSRLVKYHISGFVAHRDIEPAREWQNEIELALSTCDALVALLTPDFHQSNWTDQEIGFAMGRGNLIVSVRQGRDPYGFIGKFQAVNGIHRAAAEIAEDLYEIFAAHKLTQRSMANAIVAMFESAGTWASAKEAMSLVEKLVYWDTSLIPRLRAAVAENSQVREAFGVPERIDRFINSLAQRAN
jgi:hypothetical protein